LSGAKETIPSKMMAVLQTGDRVVITTAGGGGNGRADQRDAHAAKLDLLDGKVSLSS
jgi:N-methylhydantoinase B